MKKLLIILSILFVAFIFIALNLEKKVILIFGFIFIIGLMWKLFLRGREIERILPKEINVQKVNEREVKEKKDHFNRIAIEKIKGEEIFRKLTYFDRTAFGFYRVICKNFLYLDKKYREKELLPEKPEEKIIQNEIKENEVSETRESEGSHYLLDELPNVLKEVLDEDESPIEDSFKSTGRNKYEELIKKEQGEEAETELDIVLRRVKKRMNRVAKEIVSRETLDLEGIRRCEKVFASIMHLRNGEKVKEGIVKVQEYDCVTVLIAILKWLWVDNSFKDFLKSDDLKQTISESKFFVLNEAVLLYLFWHFFFKKPDTIVEYEMIKEGQKQIVEIYHQVNTYVKSIHKQVPHIFSEEKIEDVADEFQKIQWFSFPKDFRPFLKIFLTPEERVEFFEYRNYLWEKSVLIKMRRRKRVAGAEIERREVEKEKYYSYLRKMRESGKIPKQYLNLSTIKLERAKKQLEEAKRIIQAISLRKTKADFAMLSESSKNLDNLLCGLRKGS